MIELDFNPYATKCEIKCLFDGHQVIAKLYILFKSTHITNEHFTKRCKKLMQSINPKLKQYNIAEFIEALKSCSLHCIDEQWVVNHWDYFNPHIRRSLEFKHKFRHGKKTSVII